MTDKENKTKGLSNEHLFNRLIELHYQVLSAWEIFYKN
jgi:hypothetical protein